MKTRKDEPLKLPTTLTEPSEALGDYTMLLYGEKKIGKTSIAAQFPKALFLMCEPGGRAQRIFQQPITTWNMMRRAVKALEADKQFKTVVIDTVDVAYKLCMEHVCTQLAIDHPSDEDWGKGWNAVRDEWAGVMNRLLSLGKGVIFISHSMEAEIKTRGGSTYHKTSPTVAKQARDLLEAVVDIWAFVTYDRDRRIMYIRGDEHIGAGTRIGQRFRTPSGEQLQVIPLGSSPEEAFKNYVAAFNNKLQSSERKESAPVRKSKPGIKIRSKK